METFLRKYRYPIALACMVAIIVIAWLLIEPVSRYKIVYENTCIREEAARDAVEILNDKVPEDEFFGDRIEWNYTKDVPVPLDGVKRILAKHSEIPGFDNLVYVNCSKSVLEDIDDTSVYYRWRDIMERK